MAKDKPVEPEDIKELTFEFRGVTVTIPWGDEMDTTALRAYEQDKLMTFLEISLGQDQFAKLVAKVPKVKDLKELGEAMSAAMGTTSGE